MRLALLAILLITQPLKLWAQPAQVEWRAGDRVVLAGNTLCERMQLFNHFETLLMTRFPDLSLTVRNLCWSADTPALQPRPLNFGDAPTHLYRQKADVILAFFGQSESFLGEAGVATFEQDLGAWLRANAVAKYNGTSPVRIVLVSPIAHEKLARLPRIDVEGRNRELARYTEAMRKIAAEHKVGFVDLHTPTVKLAAPTGGAEAPPAQAPPAHVSSAHLTINGIHVTEYGDRVVGRLLVDALTPPDRLATSAAREASAEDLKRLEELREAIRDKNQQFFYRFRPVNAEYVVGRRVEPFGSKNFPGEMKQLDEMVAEGDKRIHALAAKLRGLVYPSLTGGAKAPPTRPSRAGSLSRVQAGLQPRLSVPRSSTPVQVGLQAHLSVHGVSQ